jgi:hypothetical protein
MAVIDGDTGEAFRQQPLNSAARHKYSSDCTTNLPSYSASHHERAEHPVGLRENLLVDGTALSVVRVEEAGVGATA